jgi:hypothetical protein
MIGIAEGYESIRYRIEQFISGRERTVATVAGVLFLLSVLIMVWWLGSRWRPPPSIFDSPVDDVLGYLALDDFNSLSLEERMRYLTDFAKGLRRTNPRPRRLFSPGSPVRLASRCVRTPGFSSRTCS